MKMQENIAIKDENDIDLTQIMKTIWFNKLTILLFTVVMAALSFIYAHGKTPVYSANVLLQVESNNATVPGLEQLAGLTEETATVGTEIALIKSRKNLGQAVDALKLDIVAYPKRIPIIGKFYKRFFNQDGTTPPPKLWKGIDSVLHKYAWSNERIKVESILVPSDLMNKNLILVSKENNTFDLFTKDENKFLLTGKVGVSSSSEDELTNIFVSELKTEPGIQFIVSKKTKDVAIDNMKKNIKAAEQGKQTGIIYMSMEGIDRKEIVDTLDHISQTFLAQNKSRSSEEATNALTFLEEQIKPVKSHVDRAEGNLSKYRTDNKTADLSLETQAVLDIVTTIDTELNTLALKKDELRQRYTDNHPTIQAIFSQERILEKRKEATLTNISQLPKKQQSLLKLERDFVVANTFYNDILNNIQEFKIAEASTVGNVYIIDSAITKREPIKPKKALVIMAGTILGTIFGLAMIFLREKLHSNVSNPEKLEEVTGIPVYATVPLTEGLKETNWFTSKIKEQKTLLATQNINDPAIESLRSLRTSLHFALLEAKNNIVMITGPSPGIGKSFISSNFAAVIGTSKQRVLLIDADMRKGYLHKVINQNESPGLSEVISDKATIEEATHTIYVDKHPVDIITRGSKPPNPSELLMHSNFEKFLNDASEKYDLVLIDTPPIHAVTDPAIIGKLAGVVFMVVFSDHHQIKEIEHAVKRFSQTNIQIKGFIFNGFEAKKGQFEYGYNYYDEYTSD